MEEAIGEYSKKDFAAKMSISYKEARETKYWLKLLKAGDYLEEKDFQVLFKEADELAKILFKIIQSSRP